MKKILKKEITQFVNNLTNININAAHCIVTIYTISTKLL